jgi:hypothetical protein
MHNYKVQIVKLNNGDDLIANVAMHGGEYILDEPMSFGLDMRGHTANLVMRHYLPVQLLKKNQMQITISNVLSVIDPDEEFTEYYRDTVFRLNEILKAKKLASEMDDLDLTDLIEAFEDIQHHGDTLH